MFEKAYDDLSETLDKYQMSYIHVKSDEMVSIARAMSNYIDSVNDMNESYFIMKKKMIYSMWGRCHSYIPVIFGFNPLVARHGLFDTYLVVEHLRGSRAEQEQVLKSLKDTVDKARLFIRRHFSKIKLFILRHFTAEGIDSLDEVLRIISCYQVSLENASDALKYLNEDGSFPMFSISHLT